MMRRALPSFIALVLALAVACAASCDPQKPDYGLDAIDSMQTPADPPLTCNVVLPDDATSAARRASCAFAAGSHPSDTLGIAKGTLAQIPIRHVIVLMKENRSFDHIFGKLHDKLPEVEAVPASYTNPDAQGNPVAPSHATTTCILEDPGHQSASMARCIDDGKMDGFVQNAAETTTSTDPSFAMQFYDDTDLPFYYWLAETFAVGDRDFAPTASGTYANRAFSLFATNAGVVDTGILYPSPTTPSIFHSLMNAGFTWGAYSDGYLLSGTLDWVPGDPGTHNMQGLWDAMDQGTLPNVAFVDGYQDSQDDHPPADLHVGEAWLKTLYDHVVEHPALWQRLAIVWTYDECGAFADHVTPPSACLPVPSSSPFTAMGPRVPLVVISPWAKRGYVSHVVRDHTAILRFIEALFDLPALTARDANSDALLDMFDFSCAPDGSPPPVPTAPSVGPGNCGAD